MNKRVVAALIVVAILGIGAAGGFVLRPPAESPEGIQAGPPQSEGLGGQREVIGTSVQGRDIEASFYGSGDTHIAFIGGIHGGYEWNTVLLAYTFMDYLAQHPGMVPENIVVSVVPNANPDGVYEVIGTEGRFQLADVPGGDTSRGRFNANNVDLNRNFDCKWQPESMWRGRVVSAGSSPFSEPETGAIRDFVFKNKPRAVVFWHSQANAVYPAECDGDILAETRAIMQAYANAAGYTAAETFDAYEITGSADGWLALLGIPALTVELQTHETIDWERNLEGIQALFEYYE